MSVAEALGRDFGNTFPEDPRRNRYYAGLNIDQLGTAGDYSAKPRVDENHRGIQYGSGDYDRGHPHPRPLTDPFLHEKPQDTEKIRKQKMDMDEDIMRLKERQMREKYEKEAEKKKNYDMLTKTFPWDQRSYGHGGPRKRETDLFLDTLGGPDGTKLRQNGSPALTDSRFTQQQQQFKSYQPAPRPGGMTPSEMQDYNMKIDQVSEEKRIQKQQKRINELRSQIDQLKAEESGQNSYRSMGDQPYNRKLNERRSLDLEATQGGAGAPVKDPRGKNQTRMPITLKRDDYGESTIKEDIPGKATFDLNFMEEDNKPYYPWGGQGGGAPIRDRAGNVRTQIYGKLDQRNQNDSGSVRRNKRRQEVLYNELKQVEKQQKENKDELTRYMKAPQAELAEVILQGRVGRPKRDEITGEIGQQHLPNSDVSLLAMNHQPKPVDEKKMYHDELTRMAEERQQQRQLEKLKERQESNAHFQNMDSTWGHIGGGAPKHQQIRKKANLTNSLFYPDHSPDSYRADQQPPTGLGSFEFQSPTGVSYNKLYTETDERRFPSPQNSPRFVKSTLPSSHKNMFDSAVDQKILPKAGINSGFPPYATGGVYTSY